MFFWTAFLHSLLVDALICRQPSSAPSLWICEAMQMLQMQDVIRCCLAQMLHLFLKHLPWLEQKMQPKLFRMTNINVVFPDVQAACSIMQLNRALITIQMVPLLSVCRIWVLWSSEVLSHWTITVLTEFVLRSFDCEWMVAFMDHVEVQVLCLRGTNLTGNQLLFFFSCGSRLWKVLWPMSRECARCNLSYWSLEGFSHQFLFSFYFLVPFLS